MACLTESQLQSILDEPGALGKIPGIDEHLDTCASCRALVASLALDAPSSTQPTTQSGGMEVRDLVATSLDIGTAIADRYVVLEVIGIGGMGIVYATYDRKLDRKVALKMLRPGLSDQDRLVKEAQHLARLSHPNVVVVHDTGHTMGQTYMAMEYVQGSNLRKWQQAKKPSVEAVLDVYVEAARGLAAAHAVGLVHRDVKPENIVLGEDGRVRVMDLGLAQLKRPLPVAEQDEVPLESPKAKPEGTILYMAPEVYRGAVADAHADQFAFCVALYEALYGVHPFRFKHLHELPEAIEQKRFRDGPRDRRVNGAVRSVLLRGLSSRPTDRFPTMDTLIRALQHARHRARRWILTAIAVCSVLLVAGTLVAVERRPSPSSPCSDAERQFADVWNATRRKQIADSFAATKLAYAQTAVDTVQTNLSRYVERWTSAHTEACRATRVYGEQSEELLDLRMACLERRLGEFRAMTERLTSANATMVEKSVDATLQLPAPEWCDKARVQSEYLPPPDTATWEKVQALRLRLAHVETSWRLGHDEESLKEAKAIEVAAQSVRYPALQAEIGLAIGRASTHRVSGEEQSRVLWKALTIAETYEQRRIAMDLWWWYGRHALWILAAHEEALRAADMMAARATQLGDEEGHVRAMILRMGTYRAQKKNEDGLAVAKEAVARCESDARCARVYLYRALAQLATMYGLTNQFDKSLECFDRSQKLAESLLGRDHPFVASYLNDRARVLLLAQRYEEAIRTLEQAHEISTRNGMPKAFQITIRGNLAEAFLALKRYDEAEAAIDQTVALTIEQSGLGHPDSIRWIASQGDARLAHGRYDAAIESYLRAIGGARKAGRKEIEQEVTAGATKKWQSCNDGCRDARKRFEAALKGLAP